MFGVILLQTLPKWLSVSKHMAICTHSMLTIGTFDTLFLLLCTLGLVETALGSIGSTEFSLEFCEDIWVGVIWEEILTTSKLLCSTYIKIKGICSLKALKLNFKRLRYTGENTGSA